VRTPDIPESVPFVGEFATTQEQKDILGLVISPGELGRPYVMSKQVPADRLNLLRAAFDATMKDEGFLADAEKTKIDISTATGQEVQDLVTKMYATPKPVVDRLIKAMKQQ
jgi:tripartite-type tricarboxylate transporter receptor subunit TctC